MSVPRSARMRRPDFRGIHGRSGRHAKAGPLVLHVVGGPGDVVAGGPVRVGFAVGRPVGGAVTRNAVRRRLRVAAASALPLQRGGAQAANGGDEPAPALVLVRARPGVEVLSVSQLSDLLAVAWSRVSNPARGRS